MTNLLILDKDGTLVKPASGNQFVQHPEDQELLPGVAEALQRYRVNGYSVAIASNQGGVAAGFKSLESAALEMSFAMQLTGIKAAIFCPDFEGMKCYHVWENNLWHAIHDNDFERKHHVGTYRKPGGGMIEHFVKLASSGDDVLFVGDRPEDEQAAENANVRFMWADEWRCVKRP